MKRPIICLVLGLFALCLAAVATTAGDVTLIGSQRIVFETKFGDDNSVQYPCGTIARRAIGPNYNVDNEPFFDGSIAPISYVEGSTKKLYFNVSVGYKDYRLTSTLTGSGESASFTNGVLDCHPVFVSALSASDSAFTWGEWLYGTFHDVPNNKVYSVIYNEYYGGNYGSVTPVDNYSAYAALGLAVSDDKGANFHRIRTAPDHIFLRTPELRQPTQDGQGIGWFGGIFKSPLDQKYYVAGGSGKTGETLIVRTSDLQDPNGWKVWDGIDFETDLPPTGIDPAGFEQDPGIKVNPLYIGYSDYFKKYISVTINSDQFANGRHNLIVYHLSDDLVHWGPARKLMYNPACGADHVCTDGEEPLPAYPSLMDPGYLSQTDNSIQASNGITGAHPLVTYINKGSSSDTAVRQQFATQKISFDQVVFNRMDNFSVRAVVGMGNKAAVMGFIVQGTEPKKMVFRALGPSLSLFLGYPNLRYPRISLYDGNGALLASNQYWRSGPDEEYLTSIGLNPLEDNESALVATLWPGTYTVKIDHLCLECEDGIGVLEAYDLSSTAESKIVQVAIRGYSQPGHGALTMGLISRGGQTAVIRGTGISTLAPNGFSPVIPNPYLTAYNSVGSQIASNDNWNTPTSNGSIVQSYGLAPGNSLESATIFFTTTPVFSTTAPNSVFSNYSVQLQGTGFGLLELYSVNAPMVNN